MSTQVSAPDDAWEYLEDTYKRDIDDIRDSAKEANKNNIEKLEESLAGFCTADNGSAKATGPIKA